MVKVKKLHPDAVIPKYQTHGSVGFDFHTVEDVEIKPFGRKLVKTGLAISVPDGLFLAILPRGSTFKNWDIIMPNSMGVIDNDFCGDDDEIFVPIYNVTAYANTILKGQRFAQGLFLPVEKIEEWEEVDSLGQSRNGYGSTGV